MKEIGAHAGYADLWGRVSKVVWARVQMCYYSTASLVHVMAVLSVTRVVRIRCVWVAGCPLLCGGMRDRRGCGRVFSLPTYDPW